ncbi:MAG TPA: TlpA disulfide reductase family protein, partial [Opitutaceae bacterium]
MHRLLLSAGCMALATVAGGEVGVGDTFPSLAAAGLEGTALPQTSARVVLVDFWASWCAPCKASFSAYARLDSEFASKGLVIVAVSVDEDAKSYDSFVKRLGPSFFVARDVGHKLVREAQVPTMP